MSQIGEVERVKRGRKAYRCDWCDEIIEVGGPSVRWLWKDGSEVLPTRVHPECYVASQEMLGIDPYLEWQSGDFSRGCTCLRGECECDKALEKARGGAR